MAVPTGRAGSGGQARCPRRRPPAHRAGCAFGLFGAVLLDLLKLGLSQLAWHVVAGHLGALHVVPDVLHDLGVGQGGDVADVGEVGDRGEPWGVWGGELFLNGVVVRGKRARGRPRKSSLAA